MRLSLAYRKFTTHFSGEQFSGGKSYDFDLIVQLDNCFLIENYGGCFSYVIVLLKQKCLKLLHIILLQQNIFFRLTCLG